MTAHPRAQLSAYHDDELTAKEAAGVERHLRTCTECSRELAIMRRLGGAMRSMSEDRATTDVWSGVYSRITRPVGWLLLLAGVAIWAVLALIGWLRAELTLEWAAATAAGTGLLLLAIGIGHEQYREWRETRYRDVEQ